VPGSRVIVTGDRELIYAAVVGQIVVLPVAMLMSGTERCFWLRTDGYYKDTEAHHYYDDWGIKWKKIPYQTINETGHYTEIVECLIADNDKLDS